MSHKIYTPFVLFQFVMVISRGLRGFMRPVYPYPSGLLLWHQGPCTSAVIMNHYSDVLMGAMASHLFRRRSKKTSKLRVTGLCAGNSPMTGEFPTQMASNAKNVSIWWRHHGSGVTFVGNIKQSANCGHILWYRWLNATNLLLQWASNGVTTLLHYAIAVCCACQ